VGKRRVQCVEGTLLRAVVTAISGAALRVEEIEAGELARRPR